jgi:hypothetical protein
VSDEDISKVDDATLRAFIEKCYDEDILVKRLRLRNRWSQLINSHLVLDLIANEFIDQETENKGVLKTDRWGFQQKIDLLFALGRMTKSTHSIVTFINSLRNKAAHRHDFSVQENDIEKLRGLFPAGLWDNLGSRANFRNLVAVAVAMFESERQEWEFRGLKRRATAASTRDLLTRIRAELSSRDERA